MILNRHLRFAGALGAGVPRLALHDGDVIAGGARVRVVASGGLTYFIQPTPRQQLRLQPFPQPQSQRFPGPQLAAALHKSCISCKCVLTNEIPGN